MRHTLVAAFATPTDANRTRGDLMSRGIPMEQIHSVGSDTAEIHAYDAPYTATEGNLDRTHHESRVAHFFKSLFGDTPHEEHRHYATAYPEAIRGGAQVIAVDVDDEDQLVRARDALEYNGALNISEPGGTGSTDGYAGPTSPYAGATGGDSHLDKHFTRPETTAAPAGTSTGAGEGAGLHSASERFGDGAGTQSAAEVGGLASTPSDYGDRSTADTGRYDIGSAAKRAGTDYPETTATTAPTGAGITGHGTSVTGAPAAADVNAGDTSLCSARVCVIRRTN